MDFLKELVTTGRIADLLIVFIAIEFLLLTVLRRRNGSGVPAGALFLNLGAGVFLALALKAGITGADWRLIASCIFGAGVFHALDLSRRWEKTR